MRSVHMIVAEEQSADESTGDINASSSLMTITNTDTNTDTNTKRRTKAARREVIMGGV